MSKEEAGITKVRIHWKQNKTFSFAHKHKYDSFVN